MLSYVYIKIHNHIISYFNHFQKDQYSLTDDNKKTEPPK